MYSIRAEPLSIKCPVYISLHLSYGLLQQLDVSTFIFPLILLSKNLLNFIFQLTIQKLVEQYTIIIINVKSLIGLMWGYLKCFHTFKSYSHIIRTRSGANEWHTQQNPNITMHNDLGSNPWAHMWRGNVLSRETMKQFSLCLCLSLSPSYSLSFSIPNSL